MSASRADAAAKRRRRVRPEEEKRRIVAETYERGASVSAVARRHDLNANLLFSWRRVMGRVAPASADEPTRFVPAVISTEVEAASTPVPPPPAGAMEIVLVDGARVIVDRTVDGAALARVIEALSRR
jgi:transposase